MPCVGISTGAVLRCVAAQRPAQAVCEKTIYHMGMSQNKPGDHIDKVIAFQVSAAVLWGVLGAGVALSALPNANADPRVVIGVLSVLLPGASIGAAVAIHRGRPTLAVPLLLVSVLTPTYFAWVLNLIPMFVAVTIPLSRSRGAGTLTRRRSPNLAP